MRRSLRLLLVPAVALLVAVPVSLWRAPRREPARHPHAPAPVSPSEGDLRSWSEQIRSNHVAKRPPEANEWLAHQHEDGQTFAEYRASAPNRPNGTLTTLYVVPVGPQTPAQQDLFDAAAEALSLFYSVPVERLPAVDLASLPTGARRMNGTHPQVLTTAVLDRLAGIAPSDALAVVGLSCTDLWPGDDWNFVFGQADADRRVGVWSTARLTRLLDQEEDVFRRVIQVAIHETGHLLGIHHCTSFECGMNGSNGLYESDRNAVAFCPEERRRSGGPPAPSRAGGIGNSPTLPIAWG
jgi:archaemetzincin